MSSDGAGQAVLILPPLAVDDRATAPLRAALRDRGHRVHAWRLGPNIGPTTRIVRGLRERFDQVHRDDGRQIALIGQSLGGVYARLLARERPDATRQVITIASPYRRAEIGSSTTWRLMQRLHRLDGDRAGLGRASDGTLLALRVPSTSFYIRGDAVAPWRDCITTADDAIAEQSENIEVFGTHFDLGVNPAVVLAILDRLAQPAGGWRPFSPPRRLRNLYPARRG